ncbi:MAG: malectin domain-containing carbohydrate-binding protein [Chloroflexota bacterium]
MNKFNFDLKQMSKRTTTYLWLAAVGAAVILVVAGISLAGNLSQSGDFVQTPFRINAGASENYTDGNGNVWSADQYYYGSGGGVAVRDADMANGDNTILRLERWGLEGYAIPVENGKYQVVLHFAETFTRINSSGQRVFSVDVEGSQLQNLDIFAETGGLNIGLSKSFEVVVADNQLDIKFSKNVQEPEINGIEVILLESAAPEQPVAPETGTTIRINAGRDSDYTDGNGTKWYSDRHFIDGNTANRPNDLQINGGDGNIYRDERWGLSGYSIPVNNGAYVVRLHFAENYSGISGPGQRVFNVDVEGNPIQNLDVFAETGGRHIALVKQMNVNVADGALDIRFQAIAQNPEINAIEIIPAGGNAAPPPPTPTAVPAPTEPAAPEQPAPEQPGPNPNAGACAGPMQEAENGKMVGQFEIVGDETASEKAYIRIPGGAGFNSTGNVASSYAEYCFNVTEAGAYRIGGYVFSQNGETDSFYVGVDASNPANFIWDTKIDSGFTKNYVQRRGDASAYVVNFSAGEHIVRFHHREADTRLDRVFIEKTSEAPAPEPVAPTPTPIGVAPSPENPGEATYRLTPGNINSKWPNLKAGDIVYLDPGNYTGGDINLSVNASANNPVIIQKTPGTSGKVVFDGRYSNNTLFRITGSHIQIGGTQVEQGWEPDFVVRRYDYAGIRMYNQANDIRIHHINFIDNGESNGFGIRINGQNVIIEYNRFEDNAADAMQAETGSGGTNIDNMIIRYNYGYNRTNGNPWAWNAGMHTDFVQIQRGSTRNMQIYGNMMIGFTNALLLGDSWGSVTNVTVKNNFILYEANGVSSSSKGNTSGTYVIENNTIGMYQVDGVDGGGRHVILLRDRGARGNASIRCNVFFGIRSSVNTAIDSGVSVSSSNNIETGNTTSFSEISSTQVNLGYTMGNARDLSGIYTLRSPEAGADCTQGAPFSSLEEHYAYIIRR